MTTDLEKHFFDTFGIEPQTCIGLVEFKEPHYPQITNRILLELICLITKELNCFTNYSLCYGHLREYILKEMILEKDNFTKHQVQALFKGTTR